MQATETHSDHTVPGDSPSPQTQAQRTSTNWLQDSLHWGGGKDYRLAGWMLLALLCGFLAYIARVHEVTHDVFHEMALFRETLVQGDFPQDDVFAYTPTVSPAVHHEWATGAVLYMVTMGTGLGAFGITLLKLLLISAMWLLLYRVARMRGAHPYIFAMLAFFAFPVFWVGFATLRAQLFTLVFIAAQLWMQEQDWRGRRAWILLWLVMLVAWLNLHAGFVVGLGMITFHGLERLGVSWYRHRSVRAMLRDTWHLLAAAPVAVATLLINPYGPDYVPYLIRAIRMDRPLILEWQPLWHTHAPVCTVTLFAMSVGLFVYAQITLSRSKNWGSVRRGAAFTALAAYMALRHIRHGSIYGVIWLAYVPAWISRTQLGKNLVEMVEHHRGLFVRTSQGLAAACLTFACVHHIWFPSLPPEPIYSDASFPIKAVDYLQEQQFEGNLLTPFHVGAYVSWEMFPEVKVSFDGRYEVAYQEHIMPEHIQFLSGKDQWWEILDKYPTDAVLVHKQAPVAPQLEAFRLGSPKADERPPTRTKWRLVYEDDAFLILAAEHCDLPQVDRRGEPLEDGVREAFSPKYGHWHRKAAERTLAHR